MVEAHEKETIERLDLTQKESVIVRYLSRGRDLRDTCRILSISYNTGKTHVKHIYAKLGISSRRELIDLLERKVVS
ncbi:MAG: helix-turn-helix transcriptional regulator [Raoultibacter sp.]